MGNRQLALANTSLVKVGDVKAVKRLLAPLLSQLVKSEDPLSLDYPIPQDLDRWLPSQRGAIFYFFMSGNMPVAGAFITPPSPRMIFNYNEKGEPWFKTVNYREFTGVFVQPEFRGQGIVGRFLSSVLDDYKEIIILLRARRDAEEKGVRIFSSLVGISYNELYNILHYSNETSVLELLLSYDVPPFIMTRIHGLVGKVDARSVPMQVAAEHRGVFLGYSFPWLGPAYLLTRKNRESF